MDHLLSFIVQTSFHLQETTLSSGGSSPYYLDCRMPLAYPHIRKLIGIRMANRFFDAIKSVDAVGGLELGAYPLAIAISDALSIPAFVVRKTPKAHGLTKHIEGLDSSIKKVLIVDDVVTTGKAVLTAIAKCREAHLDVAFVAALVDRGGLQNVGIPGGSLYTFSQLLRRYYEDLD